MINDKIKLTGLQLINTMIDDYNAYADDGETLGQFWSDYDILSIDKNKMYLIDSMLNEIEEL